jgi:hypothetical protein
MAKKTKAQRDPLAAASEVARALVARNWPELAGVEPTVAPRRQHTPGADDLCRMGEAAPGAANGSAAASNGEYTFTFAGQVRTSDGYTMPRIARVTVDANQQVVKATTSK